VVREGFDARGCVGGGHAIDIAVQSADARFEAKFVGERVGFGW